MNESLRRKSAAAAAKRAGVGGLLVTHLADVRYLTGFTGSNAALALVGARAVLFTDGRYTAQARAEARGVQVVIAPKAAAVAAAEWLAAAKVRKVGFDPGHTTVQELKAMQKSLPGKVRRSLFAEVGSLVAEQRWVKDAGEIVKMRRAAALGCRLFDAVLNEVVAGETEASVAAALEWMARTGGAEAMSFETIVASGPRSAMPHGKASRAKLPQRGFVTLDFGVVLEGYCSDMTRTVHLGAGRRKEREVYDFVLEAQLNAVAAVKPGVSSGEVDEAARSVLRRAKLDKYFSHSTGHGVGLEIHEGPRLAAKQKQVLQPGMVVTVEPGVYLPGKFGVRIEDMVLVTERGGEVLTPSTKAWIEL